MTDVKPRWVVLWIILAILGVLSAETTTLAGFIGSLVGVAVMATVIVAIAKSVLSRL